MKSFSRYQTAIFEGMFLAAVYFVSRLPLRDFDIWFHLKSGELFVTQKSLQFTEVFSHAAFGREWRPFEWLFQIIVYVLSSWLGLAIIPFFMSIFVVITLFFFLRILDYIFQVSLPQRLFWGFIFFASTYEFNTARPHVLAYAMFAVIIFLILSRIFKSKKWIWFSPLVTLFWANVHSTAFISWGLMLAFGLIITIRWFFERRKNYLITARDLLILTVINFLITIFPPMGFRDYKLLWHFFTNREFLGNFIAEWSPVTETDNPIGVYVYLTYFVLAFACFFFVVFKRKNLVFNLWVVPFLVVGVAGFTAARNVFLGMFGILVVLAWGVSNVRSLVEDKRILNLRTLTIVGVIMAVLLIGLHGRIFLEKRRLVASTRRYYPVQSTEFVRKYLKGNMWNDYNYGGYILYQVYPKLQVFIDGRADVYLCCEMHDYLLLAVNKGMDDDKYRQFLNIFWDEYDINFAIISTQKHNVMRRISALLNTDPDWALVFWDDDSQVFVRRDGVNDEIISLLEAKFATPYLRDPYPKDKIDLALEEYERIDKISKSARTSNAIGFIMLSKGEFDSAYERFEEAISMDPTFESPYMNLAELAQKEGNIDAAVGLYRKALSLAPDRGLIYIRLGELILEETGDKKQTRKIWENGVRNTVDDDAKEKLRELLATL